MESKKMSFWALVLGAGRHECAPSPTDAVPVACEKPLLVVGDAEYLRGLSVGGSHLVSAKWLCDFAVRIENTLANRKQLKEGPHFFPCGCCWWIGVACCRAAHALHIDGSPLNREIRHEGEIT